MRRYLSLLIVVLAFTSIACPPAPAPDPPKKKTGQSEIKPVEVPEHLRDRIEAALEQIDNRELLTTHAFWTVFHGILGSGLEKTMLTDPATKKKINAIDYICNGGEVRGLQFLPTKDGLDVLSAKDRPDWQGQAQGHQDQFIAEMAQWGMPINRKFKVAGRDFTFEDFTRQSKMRASVKQQPPQELSWAIIIIGQYYGTDIHWTNSFGEPLDYRDVVRYEVDAPINEAACGGTHRLFGLTWAYHLHLKNGGKTDGVWRDVAAKIEQYKSLAREQQGPDGACSTDYFKGKGRSPDSQLRIGTTGHTVEWLSLAMTDEELRAPWMQEAVNALAKQILEVSDREVEGGALYHAAHGLRIYHSRVYGTPPDFLPLKRK